jgi:hypothetical protein
MTTDLLEVALDTFRKALYAIKGREHDQFLRDAISLFEAAKLEAQPSETPIAWADDAAMSGGVGNTGSNAAKEYWLRPEGNWFEKGMAEKLKHPLFAAAQPVGVPAWMRAQLREIAKILDADGDEHGCAAKLWDILAAPALPVEPPKPENLVTLDKRDLFDLVRAEIKDSLTTDENSNQQAWLWEESTNRTINCLSKLYALPAAPAVEPVHWAAKLKDMMAWSAWEGVLQLDDAIANINQVASMATAAPTVELPVVIELIALQWDGCMFDTPGESVDIGQCIREYAKRAIAGSKK